VDTLHRAANQGPLVQKSIADVNRAISDLGSANTYNVANPSNAAAIPSEVHPSFTPPARPAPNRNVGLETALSDLKEGFDLLNEAPGGELGGFRSKVYADIAAAANDLIAAMNSANAEFAAGQAKDAARGNTSAPAATTPVQ